MDYVHKRQNDRVIIEIKSKDDIVNMDCGAFIDFYNERIYGAIIEKGGAGLKDTLRDYDDEIIKTTPHGLSCNMIFAVNLKKDNFEHHLSTNEFKEIIYQSFLNCFKNCVDSIVVNLLDIKKLVSGTSCDKPIPAFFSALKQFFLGKREGSNAEMTSHRYDGIIHIICSNTDIAKMESSRKSEFGRIDDTVPQTQDSRDQMNRNYLNSVKKQVGAFCSEITLVNEKVRDVQEKNDFASIQCRLTSIENTFNIVEQLLVNFDEMSQK